LLRHAGARGQASAPLGALSRVCSRPRPAAPGRRHRACRARRRQVVGVMTEGAFALHAQQDRCRFATRRCTQTTLCLVRQRAARRGGVLAALQQSCARWRSAHRPTQAACERGLCRGSRRRPAPQRRGGWEVGQRRTGQIRPLSRQRLEPARNAARRRAAAAAEQSCHSAAHHTRTETQVTRRAPPHPWRPAPCARTAPAGAPPPARRRRLSVAVRESGRRERPRTGRRRLRSPTPCCSCATLAQRPQRATRGVSVAAWAGEPGRGICWTRGSRPAAALGGGSAPRRAACAPTLTRALVRPRRTLTRQAPAVPGEAGGARCLLCCQPPATPLLPGCKGRPSRVEGGRAHLPLATLRPFPTLSRR
jgi:hypothetical protein